MIEKKYNKKRLDHFVSLQRGHDLTESDRKNGNVPVIGSAGPNGFHDTIIVDKPGVTIGRSGASFGNVFYCDEPHWPHNTVLYVTDYKGNFPLFVYYALKNIEFKPFNSGSAQASLNRNYISHIEIHVPSLVTQKAIAHILGTLDDKIELNRRMNETLESIARALFKSWFIDFDPVRAKAETQQPEGMDAATAALFPSEFETVEGQEIPKGWRITQLSEIYSIFDSKRIPLSGRERETRKGIYPYYGAASVMDFIDEYIFDGIYVLLAEDGSVINKDNSPVLQYVWGKFWVNNHAHILQGKADVSTELLMQFLQFIDIHPYVTGAVQLKVSQQNLAKIPKVLPPKEICQKYSSFIQPLYVKYRYNKENSHHLSSIRDTLLPKLLSGELSIDNPEQFIGVS
ncbi:restriction endonuclease subunit S [Methanospirillum stamsii]|uniref:Restriction endonuclease subunit S n=1 Tax=Methanospirillum stamsii TaxID=1277351 RepID=A0A2V2MQ82_9EURY|nr:restriction endonuclease subunit S [Methanospirillum stamsii]PWR69579.1 restriction endonuclease subunit S [Methanospirillum stamsii]